MFVRILHFFPFRIQSQFRVVTILSPPTINRMVTLNGRMRSKHGLLVTVGLEYSVGLELGDRLNEVNSEKGKIEGSGEITTEILLKSIRLGVGVLVVLYVGIKIGSDVGVNEGDVVGSELGPDVDSDEGDDVGIGLGSDVGNNEGDEIGIKLGSDVGINEGNVIGSELGPDVDDDEGNGDGT